MIEFPPNLFASTPLAKAMRDHPCAAIDVGSAGGIIADLNPVAFAIDAVGFEPNPDNFAALSAVEGPWRSLRSLPLAIGGENGPRKLYCPAFGNSSTLLRPNAAVGEAFNKLQFFDVEAMAEVEVVRLDDALRQYQIRDPDYLKLDVEGAEFEVLEGAARTLSTLAVIRIEVSFIEIREGQRLGMEVGHYLEQRGFRLMHISEVNPWRIRGYQTHPSVSREAIRYSRGQLIHADFLFMRDADFFAGPEHRMRGAFLAMAQGFFDHAERLLSTREVSAILENEAGPEDLTGALDAASRLMANHIWRARAKDMPRHVVRLFRDGVNLMKPRHRFEGF